MDDLRLNRTVTEPRSPGKGGRFFLLALVIAAGLHGLVFGALFLSSRNRPATAPAVFASAAVASASSAVPPEMAPAFAIAKALPSPRPQPARHATPPMHPLPVGHAATARHAHRVAPPKTPPAHKTHAKPTKAKSAPRHTPGHAKAKPTPALNLDALSKNKS